MVGNRSNEARGPGHRWIRFSSEINLGILLSSILLVVGWLVTYYSQRSQERFVRQMEFRHDYQIQAYRVFTRALNSGTAGRADFEELEKALIDVQLFGSDEQLEEVRNVIRGLNASGTLTLGPLVRQIRNDLRAEMQLSTDPEWFAVRLQYFEEEAPGATDPLPAAAPAAAQPADP